MSTLDLLGSTSVVECPFIKVVIGDYTFGVYNKGSVDSATRVNYPNYIESLTVQKINGQVNKYTLNIRYTIRAGEDPNFFDKIFGNVSKKRKIVFSYGDLSLPNYIYKEEQAIITSVRRSYNVANASKSYIVSATSESILTKSGGELFEATYAKPSDIIKQILRQNRGGITDIFYGMRDVDSPLVQDLIIGNDKEVNIELKNNISVLDYISYLVSIMSPRNQATNVLQKSSVYTFTILDDFTGLYGGSYFKISELSSDKDMDTRYEINIGYASANAIIRFEIDDDGQSALLYNYNSSLKDSYEYTQRINNNGELEQVFAPLIGSENTHYIAEEADKNWWSKVTQFPIKARLVIKGLLKPALLMTPVKINVLFYGRKDIASGTYVVTSQEDNISSTSGYSTTLSLLRIKGDEIL